MKDNSHDSHLVYSTGVGSVCPDCGKPENSCICSEIKRKVLPEAAGAVRIRYETSGRKGKGVTVIVGLHLNREGLLDLAKQLKQQFGAGGAVKDYTIELQGDHRRKVADVLRKLGYPV